MNGKPFKKIVGNGGVVSYLCNFAKRINDKNYDKFTCHSLRLSGATWLANSGISIERLMEYGRWSNDHVARMYVEESEFSKKQIDMYFNSQSEDSNTPPKLKSTRENDDTESLNTVPQKKLQ